MLAIRTQRWYDGSMDETEKFWGDGGLADQTWLMVESLKARLAEVEAERDRYRADYTMTALENEQLNSGFWGAIELRDAAEARLAAVLALCDNPHGAYVGGDIKDDRAVVLVDDIRDVATGDATPPRDTSRDWSREPTVGELGLCNPPQLTAEDYPEGL